jgi:hypothetical protein
MSEERKNWKVAVYPHIRKFMLANYEHDKGVWRAEEYTPLGKYVTLALIDRRSQKFSENDQQRGDRVRAEVTIQLTTAQASLSPRLYKLQRLNLDLDHEFKKYLLFGIRILNFHGVPPYTACKQLLELLNIDDSEYSLDAAYKYYQRTRDKIKLQENEWP